MKSSGEAAGSGEGSAEADGSEDQKAPVDASTLCAVDDVGVGAAA